MKYTLPVLIAALCVGGLIHEIDAQRGQRVQRANPFTDFHTTDALKNGKPAPHLHLKDSDGVEGNLRDYLGRWVFIEFGSYT